MSEGEGLHSLREHLYDLRARLAAAEHNYEAVMRRNNELLARLSAAEQERDTLSAELEALIAEEAEYHFVDEHNARVAAEARAEATQKNLDHEYMVRAEWARRAEAAELQLFGVLCAFYDADPVACSGICDDRIDPSGALLGRVREATEKAQKAWDDTNAS